MPNQTGKTTSMVQKLYMNQSQKPSSAVEGDKRTQMGISEKRPESKNDANSNQNKDTILVGASVKGK